MKAKISYKGFKDGQDTYLTFTGEYIEHESGNLVALKFPSGTKIIPVTRLISIWEESESSQSDRELPDAPPPPIA